MVRRFGIFRASRFRVLAVTVLVLILVAEWIHFTLLGIISPAIKLKVYTFGGL